MESLLCFAEAPSEAEWEVEGDLLLAVRSSKDVSLEACLFRIHPAGTRFRSASRW